MEIAAIHKEFHGVLSGYIARRVNNSSDAEDLVQEVFLKIYNSGSSLANKESLRSWLFTITRNTLVDYYRRKAARTRADNEQTVHQLAEEDPDPQAGADLEKCIHHFIERLPEDYRQIIIDAEISGIRQKDLADKYQLAYPSLRSRVQRGRARLKEMFLDCCKVELDRRGNILSAVPRKKSC